MIAVGYSLCYLQKQFTVKFDSASEYKPNWLMNATATKSMLYVATLLWRNAFIW